MYTRLSTFVTRLMSNSNSMRVLGMVILWIISASLLLTNLGYPRAIVFDETYYIPTVQRYIAGTFFQQEQPPLGKLLILAGQKLTYPSDRYIDFESYKKIPQAWPQDQQLNGYRIAPAVFGTFVPLLIFFILLVLLRRESESFLVALLVSFDNSLIVQSRFALIDSFLIVFCLSSVLLFLLSYTWEDKPSSKPWLYWLLWGFFSATAAAVKFTGLFVVALVPFYLLQLLFKKRWGQIISFCVIFALTFILTTVAIWQIHFSIITNFDKSRDNEISEIHQLILENQYEPHPITRFIIQFNDALAFHQKYHSKVPTLDLSKPGEIGSPWYQWPFGGRAINYRWETPDGITFRYIYLMGNPIVWLVSLFGVVGGTAVSISDALFRFLPADRRRWLYIFSFLYWAYMIPIMFIERVMYLYHYLPPLLIGIILFSLVFTETPRLPAWVKRETLIFSLVLVIIGFWIYKPLTYYEPLTNEQFEQRNVLPVWDLRCAKCGNNSEK
jgi:dolichyl-phosphate-mannose-protein mannosyltransferase